MRSGAAIWVSVEVRGWIEGSGLDEKLDLKPERKNQLQSAEGTARQK